MKKSDEDDTKKSEKKVAFEIQEKGLFNLKIFSEIEKPLMKLLTQPLKTKN